MCMGAAQNENVWRLVSDAGLGGRALNVAGVPGLLRPSLPGRIY